MSNFQQIRKTLGDKLFKKCKFSKRNKYKVCFNKACKKCYHKTLQSHYNCEYFNYDCDEKYNQYIYHPRFIIKKSKRECEFLCKCNKIYTTTPNNITFKRKWCVDCIRRNRLNKAKKYYDQFTFTFIHNDLVIINNKAYK